MTTARMIIERARGLGIRLRPEGETLRYRGQRPAIAQLFQDLEAHKREIIALLAECDPLAGIAFSNHGYLCRRCKTLGRVAVIGGEITCTFCVIAEAELLTPNSGGPLRTLERRATGPAEGGGASQSAG